jgi:hypothetical protein
MNTLSPSSSGCQREAVAPVGPSSHLPWPDARHSRLHRGYGCGSGSAQSALAVVTGRHDLGAHDAAIVERAAGFDQHLPGSPACTRL